MPSAAVGLGLAAHENLILAAYLPGEWLDHSVIRSILTVPAHGALGIISGVYVTRARFGGALGAGRGTSFRLRSYLAAWLVPIALHALYNFPLLLVRNLVGLDASYVHLLQTAGFVVGTMVILAGARLVYRISLAQVTSSGRFRSGTNGALHLVGRVAPQAGIWFSQLNSLFSFSGISLGSERVRLADLGVFGNNRRFTVSLVSRNAESTGTPSLVDQGTGRTLPYLLTYDGDPLMFVDGEAQIASGPNAGDREKGLKPLEPGMAKAADLAGGHFQEGLVIVIAAR